MLIIRGRNVNDIYPVGVALLEQEGVIEKTRNGSALVAPSPVVTVYEKPWERVLFDKVRDPNPFFHLMEALWMLSGNDDARWLDRYVADFSSRYAEEDGRMHGAYGTRWRYHFQKFDQHGLSARIDQLKEVVRLLKKDKRDRQIVISMWDPAADLGKVVKDKPCNTQLYVRIRPDPELDRDVLDLTIMCRSNDIVWGAYGANAVHMSVLQEYLAAGVGVQMGKMYQFSNNYHGYVETMGRVDRADAEEYPRDPYFLGEVTAENMFTHFESADEDVSNFVAGLGNMDLGPGNFEYRNRFFTTVATPMARAHWLWKKGRRDDAFATLEKVTASDWQRACREWMIRRVK